MDTYLGLFPTCYEDWMIRSYDENDCKYNLHMGSYIVHGLTYSFKIFLKNCKDLKEKFLLSSFIMVGCCVSLEFIKRV